MMLERIALGGMFANAGISKRNTAKIIGYSS